MNASTITPASSAASESAFAASTLHPFTADALMNGAATLFGAFLGAMLAFLFQLWLQRQQERKTELAAAHRILFCLLQQINTLILVHKDFIAPHIDTPIRFITIPALQEFDLNKNLFDFSTFSFLLKNAKGRKIMYAYTLLKKPM